MIKEIQEKAKTYKWNIIVLSLIASYFSVLYTPYIINSSISNIGVLFGIYIVYCCFFYYVFSFRKITGLKTAYPLGLLISIFIVFGNEISVNGGVAFKNINFWIATFIFSFIFCFVITILWEVLDVINNKLIDSNHNNSILNKFLNFKYNFILIWLFMLIGWIPVWLAAYPGFFCYDASYQLSQYNSHINSHHPPLHTFLLGFVIETGNKLTGSYNKGIAIYILLQMIFMSFCFAYTIYILKKWKVSNIILLIAILYYTFFPVISLFSMCSTKDGLFTSFIILFILSLLDMLKNYKEFFSSPLKIISFIIVSFIMLALRNNAIYAFLVFLIVSLFFIKKYKFFMLSIFVFIIGLNLTYTGPIFNAIGIEGGSSKEMLCVPMQQLAAVYNQNPTSFNDKDKELLYKYIPHDGLVKYNPKFADMVKDYFRDEEFNSDLVSFFKFWIKIGTKNPSIYINSFLNNTLYAWYPNSIIDGYNYGDRGSVYPKGKTSFFEYVTQSPGELNSKIPWLYNFYKSISKDTYIYKIPLVSMLFSVGFMFWFLLICIFYSLHKRERNTFIPLLFMLLLCLTVFLGPMILVRYFLILFFAFPLMIAFLFNLNRFSSSKAH